MSDPFEDLPASEPVTPEAKTIGDVITDAGFTVKYLNGIPVVRTPPEMGDKARLVRMLEEKRWAAHFYSELVIIGPPGGAR